MIRSFWTASCTPGWFHCITITFSGHTTHYVRACVLPATLFCLHMVSFFLPFTHSCPFPTCLPAILVTTCHVLAITLPYATTTHTTTTKHHVLPACRSLFSTYGTYCVLFSTFWFRSPVVHYCVYYHMLPCSHSWFDRPCVCTFIPAHTHRTFGFYHCHRHVFFSTYVYVYRLCIPLHTYHVSCTTDCSCLPPLPLVLTVGLVTLDYILDWFLFVCFWTLGWAGAFWGMGHVHA